ncbi:putative membrane protein [Prauserella shujinwangii]|uniref:Putative membrane protein n=1 Tax=Prauserella shujinwangii TaxID=1453103 RepID=A0A2T0LU00_9PSEU|nr:DUF202 domain-containing protein [Prauserella shujinwangii]PRX47211.1 putative membrane protein [Prauserella shujinwangii]
MTGRDDDAAERAQPEESEPDYRFTLANERTFLAWIRTSLGLVAGGVAVHQLVPGLAAAGPRTLLATLTIGLGALLAAASYPRWHRVQQALRRNQPLPRSWPLAVLAGGVLLITVLAGVLVVTG